jgi:hypothetical protein
MRIRDDEANERLIALTEAADKVEIEAPVHTSDV